MLHVSILSIELAVQIGAFFTKQISVMQIYGIDLAKSKFDVSFSRFDAQGTPTTPGHKIVQNNASGIKKFLAKLPKDATLVAEHTGVYGELLLKMCDDNSVPIALVGGYVIHTYKSAPDRRKTDEADCAVLREFGEGFYDRLNFCNFPERIYMSYSSLLLIVNAL